MFKNLDPVALGVSGQQSEVIELALTYGFPGIDLNMAEFATRVHLKGLPYAKRLIQSAKLRVGTFALPFNWDTDDDTFQKHLKTLAEYAAYAAELGCTRCTTLVAPANDSRPYHENFEFHRRRFQEICEVLNPAGVRLAVGFQASERLQRDRAFQFIHDLDSLSMLLNMVGASNVGLLLDIWEVIACGSSLDAVRKLPAALIVAVQVADMPAAASPAELDDNSRLLPGTEDGRIDVAGFLAILRELGYDGPVTLKPSRSVFQSRRREAIMKQAAESLDKVMQAAGA